MTGAAFPLARYDAMIGAIAECHRVDEVKEIQNKARALEIYARQANNLDAERKAVQIRIRAENRCGELLKELARSSKAEAGAARHAVGHAEPSEYAAALERTGISRQTAARYQELAAVPRERFEAALAAEGVPTTTGIIENFRAANGAVRMDDRSLWLWGQIRDFMRDGRADWDLREVFGGMTPEMQDDVRAWLAPLRGFFSRLEGAAKK